MCVDNKMSRKKVLPYDNNFGNFFGPSKPVVVKRVIDEAKAREVAARVAARASNERREEEARASIMAAQARSARAVQNGGSSRAFTSKPAQVSEKVLKSKRLKESRNFSFLTSGEPPAAATKPMAASAGTVQTVKQSVQESSKTQVGARALSSSVNNRNPRAASGGNSGQLARVSEARRPETQKSAEAGKYLSGKTTKGPAGGVSRRQVSVSQKDLTVSKVGNAKAHHKDQVAEAMDFLKERGTSSLALARDKGQSKEGKSLSQATPRKSGLPSKQASLAKPLPKAPLPRTAPTKVAVNQKASQARFATGDATQRQRPSFYDDYEESEDDSFIARSDDEEDEQSALQSILGRFRKKHAANHRHIEDSDEDDRMMEAGFDDIQKEEQRSLKIARMEDQRELELEEERERRRLEKLKQRKKRPS